MAAFLDICRFLPTAGGTTDWTYAAVVQGYQSPAAAGAINGGRYKYRAESADLTQWEVGEGTYNASTGSLSRTIILFNSAGTTAKIAFSAAPQVAIVALKEDLISAEEANSFTDAQQTQARRNINAAAPNRTRTVLTSGSGTYTTKSGCLSLFVRLVGGGGGGGGSTTSNNAGSGGPGGNTTFSGGGVSMVGGGGPGGVSNSAGWTSGASASGGDVNIGGAVGDFSWGSGGNQGNYGPGTRGGVSPFGGAGAASWGNGGAAVANSGSGGGGAGTNGAGASGGSGGTAGGYCEKLITPLAASYTYSVGAGGAGGSAGTGGAAGGTGAAGIIIIDEYY
jgi:hypothetical protein